jgi:3-dehydroquinate dehydratase II
LKIIIINGPNLNLLGKREPYIYGNKDFEGYFSELKTIFPEIELHYFQSNHEGELIDKIQETGYSFNGIILNAGGYTHTSVALADAVAAIKAPVVEVHISNIFAREKYRHNSYLSPYCVAVISGFGLDGYEYAIRRIIKKG